MSLPLGPRDHPVVDLGGLRMGGGWGPALPAAAARGRQERLQMTAGGRKGGGRRDRRSADPALGSQTSSQSSPRAPEPLAARAARRGIGAQREPVQGGRGTAGRRGGGGRPCGGAPGCPAPGTTRGRGEARRPPVAPGRGPPGEQSHAPRAPCARSAPPRHGFRCPGSGPSTLAGGAGWRRQPSGCVRGAAGCAAPGSGSQRAPGPCGRLRLHLWFSSLLGVLLCAGASTHPSTLDSRDSLKL